MITFRVRTPIKKHTERRSAGPCAELESFSVRRSVSQCFAQRTRRMEVQRAICGMPKRYQGREGENGYQNYNNNTKGTTITKTTTNAASTTITTATSRMASSSILLQQHSCDDDGGDEEQEEKGK